MKDHLRDRDSAWFLTLGIEKKNLPPETIQTMGRLSGLKNWGPAGWTFLHVSSWAYPLHPTLQEKKDMFAFLHSFASILPCKRCRQEWTVFIKANLPNVEDSKLDSRVSLTQFLVYGHNLVNDKLGKPRISYEKARELYDPTISTPSPIPRPHIAATFILVILVCIICATYLKNRHSFSAQAQNKCKTSRHRVDNVRLTAFPLPISW